MGTEGSNPSVSAEKPQINGCLFRACHEIRHFCHVCEAFRSGRSELNHESPLINLLGCGWTGRRFSAAARETARAYPSVSRGGAMRRPPFLHSGGFGRVLPTASDAVIVAAPASGCWPHGNPLLRLCLRCRPRSGLSRATLVRRVRQEFLGDIGGLAFQRGRGRDALPA